MGGERHQVHGQAHVNELPKMNIKRGLCEQSYQKLITETTKNSIYPRTTRTRTRTRIRIRIRTRLRTRTLSANHRSCLWLNVLTSQISYIRDLMTSNPSDDVIQHRVTSAYSVA